MFNIKKNYASHSNSVLFELRLTIQISQPYQISIHCLFIPVSARRLLTARMKPELAYKVWPHVAKHGAIFLVVGRLGKYEML